jgi:predicted DNA-binding transcriptional regulator YafY
MNRIDRLFGILTLIQSKKHVSAEKIAAKFDISIRTVYRDIKALCESGIPLSFEPNKGYFIVQGFFLAPLAFSDDEANALVLIENLVKGFSDRSIQKHYSTALNKVRAVLDSAQQQKLEALNETTKTQLPTCFSNDNDYLSIIQEAISSKMMLEISYTNKNSEASLRKTEPIGIIFYAFSWHLIAWCHLRSEYRDFKVSRITKLHKTLIPFSKAQHIPLQEYMKELPVDF